MGGTIARRSSGAPWAVVALLACAPADPAAPCGPGAHLDERSGACFCDPGHHGDPELECPAHADLCAEAEARLGHSVCDHAIDDDPQWTALSLGGGVALGGIRRTGKYMVPADPSARLPPVFNDANIYRLHYCLMADGFAPQFPGLDPAQYAALILTKAGREFHAGSIYELQTPDPLRFAFSVETAGRAEENLEPAEIYAVYRQLADRFAPGELGYLPRGTLQQGAAAAWVDPPFAVVSTNAQDVPYEVYATGVAYGRVRLRPADAATSFGWQDIVVFEEVPPELEGVLAAAVTGQRQDVLSHLNVLSGQRGTPNLYVADALAAFAAVEGQLVRLEAQPYGYTLRAADQAEAEAYWQEHRPAAAVENPAQLEHEGLDGFAEIPTETAEQRALARARFGAKTVGLATLSRLIDARYQTPGLGVPFHYYDEFMTTNAWEVDLGDGPRAHAYAETIAAWLADEQFRTDAELRRDRLAALRQHMEDHGVVSPELVAALRQRIAEEFGSEAIMVRLRSSSNAEDTPSFNGAGLYESTRGCAADSVPEAAGVSASACDPGDRPRPLERGLAEVWASLWNFGAFEERSYYQLDHSAIAMGVTVSKRFEGELANGVAFTGDLRDPSSRRYTINAQRGEVDVVSPTPGVSAELSLLTMEGERVARIDRVVASSLVADGEVVLDDARLQELGGLMARLAATYPVDVSLEGTPAPLLDLELKITRDDELVIKQIRTFLPMPSASDPDCGI
ncbi:MAG: hypothetical protein H6712_23780 [Myxococcales bacterium]|nr:hypothetical protein [Myxococcales bacterium]